MTCIAVNVHMLLKSACEFDTVCSKMLAWPWSEAWTRLWPSAISDVIELT